MDDSFDCLWLRSHGQSVGPPLGHGDPVAGPAPKQRRVRQVLARDGTSLYRLFRLRQGNDAQMFCPFLFDRIFD